MPKILLEFIDIKKIFYEKSFSNPIINNLTFGVSEKTLFAISGQSGVGKSTVINLAMGLDKVSSGKILFDNHDLTKFSESEYEKLRRDQFGIVFQEALLIPELTALENTQLPLLSTGLPRSKRRSAAEKALSHVGLSDRMHFFPAQLSGGQKQRVAIARGITANRRILFADEPTANLDLDNGQRIIKLLSTLIQETGITIIAATHDPRLIEESFQHIHLGDYHGNP